MLSTAVKTAEKLFAVPSDDYIFSTTNRILLKHQLKNNISTAEVSRGKSFSACPRRVQFLKLLE